MRHHKEIGIFLLLIIFWPKICFTQYILNGSTTRENCNCYVLTTEQLNQAGSVWQATKINLTQPFDFTFNVYLGCLDQDGADGMVFILQPISTSIGNIGQGLGFQGVIPSVGISLDTYQNAGDPAYDNISIKVNGDINNDHNLAGPVPASDTGQNIEDCKWHELRIVWDPINDSLTTFFDDVFRLGVKVDMVQDIFNNDPMVYWGFTGATGGAYNIQKFCTQMEPSFDAQLPQKYLCLGDTIHFKNKTVHSLGIEFHYWNFGDGNVSSEAEPSHQFTSPGEYSVTYKFRSIDGCESPVFTQDIIVGDIPKINLKIFDTCENLVPRIDTTIVSSLGRADKYEWRLNNQLFSTQKSPDYSTLPPDKYDLSFQVVSEYGCSSNVSTTKFTIKPKPLISFNTINGCKNELLQFKALQSDRLPIKNWKWHFEKDIFSEDMNTSYTFTEKANYPVTLMAVGDNGCTSEFVKEIFINSPEVSIRNDTIVLPDMPFQLNAAGGVSYAWSPASGLSNPYIQNPTAKISDDTRYLVTVSTMDGCTDTASVNIIVFKGSSVYVPNAFTPNGDGLNDFLRPHFVGIKSLSYFTIFDRWGNKIFASTNMGQGWNGTFGGRKSASGSYVWMLRAEDIIGKVYILKGNFLLIE